MKNLIIFTAGLIVLLPCNINAIEPEYLDYENKKHVSGISHTNQLSFNNLSETKDGINTYNLSINKYLTIKTSQIEIILDPTGDKHNYNPLLESLYIPDNNINQDGPRPESLTFGRVMKSTAYGALYGLGVGCAAYLINVIISPGEDINEMMILDLVAIGAGFGLVGALLFGG